ncbi:hypothetical protein CDL15_Pgr000968 [Punica granatum]|nr:hypothetical protein CDL15_Pgr000968 [Punica granatum]PKI61261.1 hypothetical protein CRG98_018325 [Punica granatum]
MEQITHILPLTPLVLLIILSLGLLDNGVLVQAQYGYDLTSNDAVSNFQPSLVVVIGILTIMFALTLILLMCLKYCHWSGTVNNNNNNAVTRSRQFSGIDRTVIESLPFFRYSSLRGSRAGLECSVCLSKFEDIEILRLLPKCKHAFHIDCIDHWLKRHSTCPLCRHRVSTDDPSIFGYSNSMRLLNSSVSERIQDPNSLEIFIEREEESSDGNGSSSRFNIGIGSSFRKVFRGSNNNSSSNGKDEESLIIQEEGNQKMLHKLNHRIVVSNVVFQNRWSNVSSSDLMFLNSEMLNALLSDRFSALEPYKGSTMAAHCRVDNDQIGMIIKERMDRKRLFESKLSSINKTGLVSGPSIRPVANTENQLSQTNGSNIVLDVETRSQSEITAVSRFRDLNIGRSGRYSKGNRKEERRRKLWLPIARRTVQWFANREQSSSSRQGPLDVINTTKPKPDPMAL